MAGSSSEVVTQSPPQALWTSLRRFLDPQCPDASCEQPGSRGQAVGKWISWLSGGAACVSEGIHSRMLSGSQQRGAVRRTSGEEGRALSASKAKTKAKTILFPGSRRTPSSVLRLHTRKIMTPRSVLDQFNFRACIVDITSAGLTAAVMLPE